MVRTERLVLRAPELEDEGVLFAVHADPATNRHNPYGPMADRTMAHEWITAFVSHWHTHAFGHWCVSEADDTAVIGFAGVEVHEWQQRTILNLYYRLTPAKWGQGYATEAALEAVRTGQRVRPDLPIVARTRVHNLGSIRVAEKVGLTRLSDSQLALLPERAPDLAALASMW